MRRAGLDRIGQRAARLPVDRTLIAAVGGEPLLQRLDLVARHAGKLAPLLRGGPGNDQEMRQDWSTPIPEIGATCMPVSMPRR